MVDAPPRYSLLPANHFLDTHVRIVREWRTQDVVLFSQLVDLSSVEAARAASRTTGAVRASYTAWVVHAVAQSLRESPKLNRAVCRTLRGYRWVQFTDVDIAVGTEAIVDGVDIAYVNVIRNADAIGLDGITQALAALAAAPQETLQLRRLQRLPPRVASWLARLTAVHPRSWVEYRGGAAAVTSPAKYGVESIAVRSSYPLQFAFGRVAARPMVVEGTCMARPSVVLSMSWHRELTTGAVAARFFDHVVRRLELASDGPMPRNSDVLMAEPG